jgi:hypothetical protein
VVAQAREEFAERVAIVLPTISTPMEKAVDVAFVG